MIFDRLFKKKKKETDDKVVEKKEPKRDYSELEKPVRYYFPVYDEDIALLKTHIAGVNIHLTMDDARKPCQGFTKFEPDNPVNGKAVKLVDDNGRLLGYIPDRDLSMYYRIFEKRDGIRFYGAVGVYTPEGKRKKVLFGNIMIVDIPESDDGTLFKLGQKQLDFLSEEFVTE